MSHPICLASYAALAATLVLTVAQPAVSAQNIFARQHFAPGGNGDAPAGSAPRQRPCGGRWQQPYSQSALISASRASE